MKVFISYKWEDSKHNAWVEKLSADLRKYGIETYLDKWSVRYGDSFTEYMTSMIGKADIVLFIMTTKSVEAVESSENGGVKFELQVTISRIIAGDRIRLIPIYREGSKIASYLRDRRYAEFRDNSLYGSSLKDLVDDILEKKEIPPVKLATDVNNTFLHDEDVILQKLNDPFSFLNAENIYSPKLFRDLCSTELGFFRKMTSPNHQRIVISGPRGSGKTMILKYMRFVTQFDQRDQNHSRTLDQIPYIGLLLSIRREFWTYLITSPKPGWSSDINKILFYCNILFSLELLEVLIRLDKFRLERKSNIKSVIKYVSDSFHLSQDDEESLKSQLVDLARSLLSNINSSTDKTDNFNSSPAYMHELSNIVKRSLECLSGKSLALLVDDLSFHRTPEKVMQAIYSILFYPGSTYLIRISKLSDGMPLSNNSNLESGFGRDLIEIDLSAAFFSTSTDISIYIDDINDILTRRFQLAGHDEFKSIQETLGYGIEAHNFGSEIRRLAVEKKMRTLRYHGCQLLIHLFTGEIAYLLELLRMMYDANENKHLPINIAIQNQVIRNYSWRQIYFLRDIKSQFIPSLYDVCFYFGTLSKYMLIKKGHEFLRMEIEIDDDSTQKSGAIKELIAFGLFVDAGYGNTATGKIAKRLLFRKIFTPAFPTSFVNRNAFVLNGNAFEVFINNPREYANSIISQRGDEIDQMPLF